MSDVEHCIQEVAEAVVKREGSLPPPSIYREPQLKDSGERRQFDTGSVRDMSKGKGRYDLRSPWVTARKARHDELGGDKYGDHNWIKGQPFSAMLDSAMRHLNKWQRGERDEDHLIAAIWNLEAIAHFECVGRAGELDDVRGVWESEEGQVYNPSVQSDAGVRG